MGQALYRKYRTTTLDETVGQEHITQTLANALKSNKISHAYLFTGPRGVGKTSIARILAHEVNNLPYSNDSAHLDIIEIDAASNRRIDEIRELRERVHTAPTSAKFKVYIIDEVHMLTKEAFNALLKTLEEPPAHVIFILATTESHKLPETIVSRTQRFTFRPIDEETVVKRLRYISDKESINITDEALLLIAQAGGGSFRDSISLLDQTSNSSDSITADEVRRVLGIAPETALQDLIKALDHNDPARALSTLHDLREAGYQSAQIAKQLIQALRTGLINGKGSPSHVTLLAQLLDVPTSTDTDTKLDIVIVGHAMAHVTDQPRPQSTAHTQPPASTSAQPLPTPKPVEAPVAPPIVGQPSHTTKATKQPVEASSTADTIPPKLQPKIADPSPDSAKSKPHNSPDQQPTPESWDQILQAIKQKHNTLYSILRMATPEYSDKQITLYFAFPFHQKRINEPKNKQVVTDIVTEIVGSNVSIECKHRAAGAAPSPDAPSHTKSQSSPAESISSIESIFGAAEILPK